MRDMCDHKGQYRKAALLKTYDPDKLIPDLYNELTKCENKASNDWIDKRAIVYVVNKFSLPIIRKYFVSRGVNYSDDAYALSEMVQ